MLKIEQSMNKALVDGKDFSQSNTTVVWVRHENGDPHSASIYLHGNKIGWYYWSGTEESWMLLLDDCNWQTPTTKSRLNALLRGIVEGNFYLYQEDFVWQVVRGDGVPRTWTNTERFPAMPPAGHTNERRTQ